MDLGVNENFKNSNKKTEDIIDFESLPNLAEGKDLLPGKPHQELAEYLVSLIENQDKGARIGLEGKYGSGKTNLLKILQKEISEKENLHFIYFDIWGHKSEHLRRSFLMNMVQFLLNDERIKKKETKKKLRNILIRLEPYYISGLAKSIFIYLIFMPAIVAIISNLPTRMSLIFGILVASILGFLVFKLLRNKNENHFVLNSAKTDKTQEEFKEILIETIVSVENDNNNGNHKFVIAIDNLDRIENNELKESWANLQVLFQTENWSELKDKKNNKTKGSEKSKENLILNHVWMIIPYNSEYLLDFTEKESSTNFEKCINSFFHKGLDYRIPIPDVQISDWSKLVETNLKLLNKESCKEYFLYFNADLHSLLSIRKLNNFINQFMILKRYHKNIGNKISNNVLIYYIYRRFIKSPYDNDKRIRDEVLKPNFPPNKHKYYFESVKNQKLKKQIYLLSYGIDEEYLDYKPESLLENLLFLINNQDILTPIWYEPELPNFDDLSINLEKQKYYISIYEELKKIIQVTPKKITDIIKYFLEKENKESSIPNFYPYFTEIFLKTKVEKEIQDILSPFLKQKFDEHVDPQNIEYKIFICLLYSTLYSKEDYIRKFDMFFKGIQKYFDSTKLNSKLLILSNVINRVTNLIGSEKLDKILSEKHELDSLKIGHKLWFRHRIVSKYNFYHINREILNKIEDKLSDLNSISDNFILNTPVYVYKWKNSCYFNKKEENKEILNTIINKIIEKREKTLSAGPGEKYNEILSIFLVKLYWELFVFTHNYKEKLELVKKLNEKLKEEKLNEIFKGEIKKKYLLKWKLEKLDSVYFYPIYNTITIYYRNALKNSQENYLLELTKNLGNPFNMAIKVVYEFSRCKFLYSQKDPEVKKNLINMLSLEAPVFKTLISKIRDETWFEDNNIQDEEEKKMMKELIKDIPG